MRQETGKLRDLSFDTISGAGPNGAIVHYHASAATERTLEPGSLYLVDSGGQYRDGTTDITRTVAIGAPTAEMRDRFTRVLMGHIAISELRFPPGTNGAHIDAFARHALWQAGFDYDHGTGHGVGSYLSVHEGPQSISKRGQVVIEAGMILSNEPGYYKTGAYGIRIENLLLVHDASPIAGGERPMMGFETLTLVPIDRRLVDPALLGPAGVAWLNAYHARVAAEIGPHLTGADRDWLDRATAPVAG
jgi:Xaa-Pro aminopeptidase